MLLLNHSVLPEGLVRVTLQMLQACFAVSAHLVAWPVKLSSHCNEEVTLNSLS